MACSTSVLLLLSSCALHKDSFPIHLQWDRASRFGSLFPVDQQDVRAKAYLASEQLFWDIVMQIATGNVEELLNWLVKWISRWDTIKTHMSKTDEALPTAVPASAFSEVPHPTDHYPPSYDFEESAVNPADVSQEAPSSGTPNATKEGMVTTTLPTKKHPGVEIEEEPDVDRHHSSAINTGLSADTDDTAGDPTEGLEAFSSATRKRKRGPDVDDPQEEDGLVRRDKKRTRFAPEPQIFLINSREESTCSDKSPLKENGATSRPAATTSTDTNPLSRHDTTGTTPAADDRGTSGPQRSRPVQNNESSSVRDEELQGTQTADVLDMVPLPQAKDASTVGQHSTSPRALGTILSTHQLEQLSSIPVDATDAVEFLETLKELQTELIKHLPDMQEMDESSDDEADPAEMISELKRTKSHDEKLYEDVKFDRKRFTLRFPLRRGTINASYLNHAKKLAKFVKLAPAPRRDDPDDDWPSKPFRPPDGPVWYYTLAHLEQMSDGQLLDDFAHHDLVIKGGTPAEQERETTSERIKRLCASRDMNVLRQAEVQSRLSVSEEQKLQVVDNRRHTDSWSAIFETHGAYHGWHQQHGGLCSAQQILLGSRFVIQYSRSIEARLDYNVQEFHGKVLLPDEDDEVWGIPLEAGDVLFQGAGVVQASFSTDHCVVSGANFLSATQIANTRRTRVLHSHIGHEVSEEHEPKDRLLTFDCHAYSTLYDLSHAMMDTMEHDDMHAHGLSSGVGNSDERPLSELFGQTAYKNMLALAQKWVRRIIELVWKDVQSFIDYCLLHHGEIRATKVRMWLSERRFHEDSGQEQH
ncbi:hypothetical protein CALCODRAFT_509815 [Calocera cornea HHB12733]|uniref:JmjC domain-containing protein n=1 Tax=Calocera cornea HHB12733 TaxID=1353952 RepID=A0A165EZA3_9BASI|nr:hypothetical protein CALCODRAFT_509815 [Calocera cornea HHB12733]